MSGTGDGETPDVARRSDMTIDLRDTPPAGGLGPSIEALVRGLEPLPLVVRLCRVRADGSLGIEVESRTATAPDTTIDLTEAHPATLPPGPSTAVVILSKPYSRTLRKMSRLLSKYR